MPVLLLFLIGKSSLVSVTKEKCKEEHPLGCLISSFMRGAMKSNGAVIQDKETKGREKGKEKNKRLQDKSCP